MPGSTTAGLSAADTAALAATEAAIAAGKDPFGDNDDESAAAALPATEAADTTDAAEDGDDGQATAGDDDDEAQQASAATDGEQPATEAQAAASEDDDDAPPAVATRSLADIDADRKAARDERAKAFKDYSDGVIDADEFNAIDAKVSDRLDDLAGERTQANAAANERTAVLNGIIREAKKAGTVDYGADGDAAARFDFEMGMLAKNPENQGLSYRALANKAHKAVLRSLGKEAPDTTTRDDKPAKEAAKPRENGKGPATLRDIPAAHVPNAGGGWQSALAGLTGQEYERAYERLTPAQKAALLN